MPPNSIHSTNSYTLPGRSVLRDVTTARFKYNFFPIQSEIYLIIWYTLLPHVFQTGELGLMPEMLHLQNSNKLCVTLIFNVTVSRQGLHPTTDCGNHCPWRTLTSPSCSTSQVGAEPHSYSHWTSYPEQHDERHTFLRSKILLETKQNLNLKLKTNVRS